MKTSAAIAHFGNRSRVALSLGLSRAAVSKWGEVVPLESAMALAILTGGKLIVDETLYPALHRAETVVARPRASAGA